MSGKESKTPEIRTKVNTDTTLALLDEWLDEADTADAEEVIDAERELAEFKSAMNAERKRAGARLLY